MHFLQNLLAVAPKWLVSSDALALSANIHSTGAIMNILHFKCESYTMIPCSSCSNSFTNASAISSADIVLEQHIKWILLNCRAIFMGSPAMLRVQISNLFQTFDLFPLVSSVYKTRGAITEIHPPLITLTGNSATYSSYAYTYVYSYAYLVN